MRYCWRRGMLTGASLAILSSGGRARDLDRKAEGGGLPHPIEGRHRSRTQPAESLDDQLDEHFGCGGARGDRHATVRREPCGIDVLRALDEVRRDALPRAHLAQAVGVGAVAGADDEQEVGLGRERSHRVLTVLRGVADVVQVRPLYSWESAP